MKTIGLICEGVSEINVMGTILLRFLGDEYVVNPVEPETIMENGVLKQSSAGGWSRVLDHCNEQKFLEILQMNDYLVVQIDSDACEQYGVSPLDENSRRKSPEDLYPEIVSRLCEGLSEQFRRDYLERILFAICFDEIECWLLPLYYTDDNRCRTHNCIFTINKKLRKQNLPTIPTGHDKNSPNARKAYTKVLKNIRNKRVVEEISAFNYGFHRLISDLQLVAGREN